jgi:hypothetical protein
MFQKRRPYRGKKRSHSIDLNNNVKVKRLVLKDDP